MINRLRHSNTTGPTQIESECFPTTCAPSPDAARLTTARLRGVTEDHVARERRRHWVGAAGLAPLRTTRPPVARSSGRPDPGGCGRESEPQTPKGRLCLGGGAGLVSRPWD